MSEVATTRPHSLRANVIAIFAGQVATWLITAVTFAALSRHLGASGFGILSLSGTFASLGVVLGGLGMGTLITREVARSPNDAPALLMTALWTSMILGVFASGIVSVSALFAGYSRSTEIAIVLGALGIPFTLVAGVTYAAIQGAQTMRSIAIMDVTSKLAWLIAIVGVSAAGGSLVDLLVANLVLGTVTFGVQVAYLRRWMGVSLIARIDFRMASMLVQRAIPFSLIGIFFTVYTSIDVLLLSKLADSRDVGLYTAPMRIFGTMLFLPVTIMTVAFPKMSAAAQDSAQLASIATRALRLSVGTGVPIAFIAVALSDERLIGLLGSGFDDSAAVLVVLACSLVPTSVSIVASRIVFATGRESAMSVIGLGAAVAKLVLGLLLIPVFEQRFQEPALGAAVGLVGVECVMTVIMMRFMPPGVMGRQQLIFYAKLAAASLLAVGAAAAVWPSGALVASGFGCLTYAVACAVTGACGPREAMSFARSAMDRTHGADAVVRA